MASVPSRRRSESQEQRAYANVEVMAVETCELWMARGKFPLLEHAHVHEEAIEKDVDLVRRTVGLRFTYHAWRHRRGLMGTWRPPDVPSAPFRKSNGSDNTCPTINAFDTSAGDESISMPVITRRQQQAKPTVDS